VSQNRKSIEMPFCGGKRNEGKVIRPIEIRKGEKKSMIVYKKHKI
jgi:hypothetical protein